jgi:hypothetical protein
MDRVGQFVGGKYRLVRLLGEGGMGAVYEARHELIGRRCAVKFLHGEYARQAEVVKRFLREAQAASAVGHPAIIDIYDVGTTEDGSPYMVMEFLDGTSVAGLLADGKKVPVAQAVEIAVQVLSGLAAAHRRGIVHRDLKPDNLYLVQVPGACAKLKILDFGISRVMLAGDLTERLTQTGTVLGTPFYMAPEQAMGRSDIDHRLDVYAMGVILFEMLTGCVPFSGSNFNQIVVRILTERFPAPRSADPSIPPALEEVILRATSRDRDLRYADADAMTAALLPFLDASVLARLGLSATAAVVPTAGVVPTAPAVAPIPTEMSRMAERTAIVAGRRRIGLWLAIGIAAATALAAGLIVWSPWSQLDSGYGPPPLPAAPETAMALPAVPPAPPTPDPVGQVVAAAPNAPAVEAPGPLRAPASDDITISIPDLPPGAQVFFDGLAVARIPFRVRRSTISVPLEVRFEGRQPFRQMITPKKDLQVAVTLRPLGAPGPRPTAPPPEPIRPITVIVTPPPPPPEVPAAPPQSPTTTVTGAHGTEIRTDFDE